MPLPTRLLAALAALVLLIAACSESDDDATDTDETETATETTAAADTEEAETADTDDADTDDADSDDAATGGVALELGEWFISEPGALSAGPVTFDLTNTGENPHALAIVRGTSYEELPLKDNGAVDIEAVGDDFLGSTDNIESGSTGSIDFDLEPGDYVFFCPIEFGPNSHAGAGQVLSVTVGG